MELVEVYTSLLTYTVKAYVPVVLGAVQVDEAWVGVENVPCPTHA